MRPYDAVRVVAQQPLAGDGADLDHAGPDAVVTADAAALQAAVFGGAPLPEGAVTGDAGPAEWFVRLFPRPVPRPA